MSALGAHLFVSLNYVLFIMACWPVKKKENRGVSGASISWQLRVLLAQTTKQANYVLSVRCGFQLKPLATTVLQPHRRLLDRSMFTGVGGRERERVRVRYTRSPLPKEEK